MKFIWPESQKRVFLKWGNMASVPSSGGGSEGAGSAGVGAGGAGGGGRGGGRGGEGGGGGGGRGGGASGCWACREREQGAIRKRNARLARAARILKLSFNFIITGYAGAGFPLRVCCPARS